MTDAVMAEEQGRLTFRERLCHKDFTRSKKYVESTTTHGVVHVFKGHSKIRRLFWAFIFLGAVVGCLYNIADRINYLAGGPTATTISLKRERSLPFPAVTVCNLNVARRSHLEENGLVDFVSSVYLVDPDDPSYDCESNALSLMPAGNLSSSGMNAQLDTSFHDVQFEGRHALEDFIAGCFFQGRNCPVRENFVPVLTQLGYCYTFNSGRNGRPINYTNGTGPRQGLQLLLNIQQSEYIASLIGDAGVKIAVHPQGEPGQPNIGVAVPPGRNAFIGLREKRVEDTSSGRRDTCRDKDDQTSFNFLQGMYDYSTSACLVDCFFTNIANTCGCIEGSVEYPPISNAFRSFPNCSASDICCVIEQYAAAESCDCPTACEYTVYDISTSYSAFPSESVAEEFARERNITVAQVSKNYLAVEIYFESLNVGREVTEDAYSVIALLSDIGGLLALFVGASVISVLEFGMWLLDELKDRCFGIGDKEIHNWVEAERRKWKERKRHDSSSQDSTEMKELPVITIPKEKETDV